MTNKMSKNESRQDEIFLGVAECISNELLKLGGVSEGEAAVIGNQVADQLAEHWKGQSIYIPSNRRYKTTERDEEICRRMTTGNASELAKEFGISYVRVYQIYSRYVKEKRRLAEEKQTQSGEKSKQVSSSVSRGIQSHNFFTPFSRGSNA